MTLLRTWLAALRIVWADQSAPHQDRFGRATYVGPAHYLALALCAALFAALMVALKP
jgi:hypothetical protein